MEGESMEEVRALEDALAEWAALPVSAAVLRGEQEEQREQGELGGHAGAAGPGVEMMESLATTLVDGWQTQGAERCMQDFWPILGRRAPLLPAMGGAEEGDEGESCAMHERLLALLRSALPQGAMEQAHVPVVCAVTRAYIALLLVPGSSAFNLLSTPLLLRCMVLLGRALKQCVDAPGQQGAHVVRKIVVDTLETVSMAVQRLGFDADPVVLAQFFDYVILSVCAAATSLPDGARQRGAALGVAQKILVQHGATSTEAASQLCRSVLPLFALSARDPRLPNGLRARMATHDAITATLVSLTETVPDVAAPIVVVVAQRAAAAAPEKKDLREAVQGATVQLASRLSKRSRVAFLVFLQRLSRAERPQQRAFALELLADLLCQDAMWIASDDAALMEAPSADDAVDNASANDLSTSTSASRMELGSPAPGGQGSVATGAAHTPAATTAPAARTPAPVTPALGPLPNAIERCFSERFAWSIHSIASIASRVQDKAPVVRARALAALTDLCTIVTNQAGDRPDADANADAERHANASSGASSSSSSSTTDLAIGHLTYSLARAAEGILRVYPLPSCEELPPTVPSSVDLIELCRERAEEDDKAQVRRSAVAVLESLLMIPAVSINRMAEKEDADAADDGDNDVSRDDADKAEERESMPALFTTTHADMFAIPIMDDDTMILVERCTDKSVAIRKQAAAALTNLLMARGSANMVLQDAWVRAVLPLVTDPEATMQQKTIMTIKSVIYDRIAECDRFRTTAAAARGSQRLRDTAEGINDSERSQTLAVWPLLERISTLGMFDCLAVASQRIVRDGHMPNIHAVLRTLREATLSPAIFTANPSHTDSTQSVFVRRGGWMLLEAVLSSLQSRTGQTDPQKLQRHAQALKSVKRELGFVMECWEERCTSVSSRSKPTEFATTPDEDRRMLRVIAMLADQLPGEQVHRCTQQIERSMYRFEFDADTIADVVAALVELSAACASGGAEASASGADIIRNWGSQSVEICLRALHEYVFVAQQQQQSATAAAVVPQGETDRETVMNEEAKLPDDEEEADHEATSVSRADLSRTFQGTQLSELIKVRANISESDLADLWTALAQRALFTVGELAMIGFSLDEDTRNCGEAQAESELRVEIPNALVRLVQVLTATHFPSVHELINRIGPSARDGVGAAVGSMLSIHMQDATDASSSSAAAAAAAVAAAADAADVLPASNTSLSGSASLLTVTAPASTSASTTPTTVPCGVRALALVTLGKLCMRNRRMAKETVMLFVRELALADSAAAAASSPAVRSNALVVLADLCVRFTSLVDRHIGAMARCLQDEHPAVRRNALLLLSQLLLQDYLKWRGLLFHRFLATLVDVDETLAATAEYVLFQVILVKHPSVLTNNFVESIIVFNNYTGHPSYQAAASQGAEGGCVVTMEGAMLAGAENARRRWKLYQRMMQQLTDEQKFQVMAKMVQEIVAPALEWHDLADANAKATCVLRDALAIIRSPELRVGAGRGGGAGGEDPEDMELALAMQDGNSGSAGGNAENVELVAQATNAAMARAKGKMLTKISRKHMLEHVLPTLMSLKHWLATLKSTLQRDWMETIAALWRTYREEVRDILSSDPITAQELEYDIKAYERMRKQQMQQQQQQQQQLTQQRSHSHSRSGLRMGSATPAPVTPGKRRRGGLSTARRFSVATSAQRSRMRRSVHGGGGGGGMQREDSPAAPPMMPML